MKSLLLFFILIISASPSGFASDSSSAPKGLLPEIRLSGNDEDKNQYKALETEVMISKSENEAIASLKKIIQKRKGQPEEASLWNRLAELYMRRAKSGRFFDLYRDSDSAVRFVAPAIRGQTASQYLRESITIYDRIEKQWSDFEDLDAVLFNCAFAHQQLNEMKPAEEKYSKLVQKFPHSTLIPDAELALGEMNYDAHRFNVALEHFQSIEKFPKSRVYSYGLYKTAWTLYNLKQNTQAIDQLIKVVKYFDPKNQVDVKANHNLRTEAIRDLGLFFGDVYPAEKAYSFFAELCTTDELGDAMISLTHLYQSHSRDKEIVVFLPDFIQHEPQHGARVTAELALCESFETTKNRSQVVEHLETVSQLCETNSSYRTRNQKTVAQTCDMDFPRSNIEYAKKWWDLWQKNKQNKEIVGFTLKAFEIHLRHDDPKKPDTKSRYAFAELLYQMGDFAKASEQYERVSDNAVDTVILHDSSYSALVSAEKNKDMQASATQVDNKKNIIRLSQKYLTKNPQGQHVAQVKFKIGFTYYELSQFTDAETWLKPLAMNSTTDKTALEFKRKAEDLEMDILNHRKDYPQIVSLAGQLLKDKMEPARRDELTKILEEAKFAHIQSDLTTAKDQTQKWTLSQKLSQFSKEHSTSPLAKDALWQSLSLAYTTGHAIDAADMTLQFVQTYPKEAKNKDALKEAAKTYAENGFLSEAASTLQTLSQMTEGKEKIQFIEATADIFLLVGEAQLARLEYMRLLEDKSKENQSKVYSQILATFKGKENSEEYHTVENKILSSGVEPYYSLMQVKLSETLVSQRRWIEAFNSTKTLINGNGSSEAKARAHLVRGRVLEEELVNQSLKTSLERLSVVLALKTEKLDKAQQAYSLAEKLAEKPETQALALMGLSRSYQNYISSVSSPTLKTELNPEEQTALQNELNKILKPVSDKLADIQKRVAGAARNVASTQEHQSNEYLTTPASETLKPLGKLSAAMPLDIYLPEKMSVAEGKSWEKFELSKKSNCSATAADLAKDQPSLELMARVCAAKHNAGALQKIAAQLVRLSSQDAQGLFFMAIAASDSNESNKSLWLYDLALKKDPTNPVLHYNKARELLRNNSSKLAFDEFKNLNDPRFSTDEIKLVSALDAYNQGDCLSSQERLSELNLAQVKMLKALPILAECTSIKGEPDQAIKILKKDLKENSHQPELWLELARLHEAFKFEKTEAISAYQNAALNSSNEDLKSWVKRKIEFLSGNKISVTVLNSQHVDTRDRNSGTIGGPE